jgi:hypothetical protein
VFFQGKTDRGLLLLENSAVETKSRRRRIIGYSIVFSVIKSLAQTNIIVGNCDISVK